MLVLQAFIAKCIALLVICLILVLPGALVTCAYVEQWSRFALPLRQVCGLADYVAVE
ncbi:hypothetical protein SAMN05428978_10129 [Nitrosomonas sp. Nm34]|nr:hypothetical protein SAMN05428978_10129 [Nitrosomonas sp. Nm34]